MMPSVHCIPAGKRRALYCGCGMPLQEDDG